MSSPPLPPPPGGLKPSNSPVVNPFSSLETIVTARSRYLCAFLAIFLFDWLSLLPLERRHVWNARGSSGKVMFLLLRYWTLFSIICTSGLILLPVSSQTCQKMYWLEPVGGMLITYLSLIILSIRVVAIYNRRVTIVVLLTTILAVVAGWLIYDLTLFKAFQFPPPVAEAISFHGCIAAAKNERAQKILTSMWTASLIADFVLVSLTIYQSRILSEQDIGAVNPPLIRKIRSSGILYYVLITSSNLINTILYSIPNQSPTFKVFHASASDVLTSLLTARLVLHLFETPSSNSTTRVSVERSKRRMESNVIELRISSSSGPGWRTSEQSEERGSVEDRRFGVKTDGGTGEEDAQTIGV